MYKKWGISQLNSIVLRTIGNQLGVSIVEVLIALGLAAMLGWVLADQQAIQLKNNAYNQAVMTAMDLKNRLGMLLRDDLVWANIIAQNSTGGNYPAGGMDCLGNNTSCSARISSPLAFKLYPQSGSTPSFSGYVTSGTNQPGFTTSGAPCNTFNDNSSGDATCVFGYSITWEVDAPCSGTCINPPVRITAKLAHRPLPGIIALNTDKYSYAGSGAFIHSSKATMLTWQVQDQITSSTTVPGTGGGACNTATPTARILTTVADPASLLSGSGTQTITVNAKGTFNCTYSAQSFATGNFTVSFLVNGVVQNSASATAVPWLAAGANGSVTFTVSTAPFTFQLAQICQSLPGGTDNNFTLGMPVPAGGPYLATQAYASVNCASVIN